MGFFSQSQLKKETKIEVDPDQLDSDCTSCGLYKYSKHPKIEVSGEGKKKILIVGEFSTIEDDEYGVAFNGDPGELLRQKLRFQNITLNKDCWRINAVRCKSKEFGKPPTKAQIKACHPYLEKIIKKLKPKLILVMGDVAINSFFGEDFSNRTTNRWRRYCIPDEKFECNIIPLFSPNYVDQFKKDKNLSCLFDRDLKYAINRLKNAEFERKDFEQYITPLKDFTKVKKLLNLILKRKPTIAYDYEATGLKPFKEGHKIVTIGVAVSNKKAFAFPYQWKNFWTEKEFLEIKRLWTLILKKKKVKKIAHNCFSGEVKYLTKRGLVSFNETEGTTQQVWTKEGWADAKIRCYGEAYLSKITVGPEDRSRSSIKREIFSTENHRWVVKRRFQKYKKPAVVKKIEVTTDQLQIRDRIIADHPEFTINQNSEAFKHGLIFADGTQASAKRDVNAFQIRLCGKKEKYKSSFPKYTYPPSANGDPVVNWYSSSFNMKELPINPSAEYVANFIEGWNAGDGTDSKGGSRVITTFNKKAADWLKENSSIGGWSCTGFSEHIQKPNDFCNKENRAYWMIVITKEKINWNVKSIKYKVKKEKVYCASLNKGEFTLQYGIYTRNSKFEEVWGAIFFNQRHDWFFDTMMAEHILDNRVASTGLKFQSFVRFGVRPYDKDIEPFLKSEGEFNKIEQAPLNELLIYNGLDCLFSRMLYKDQYKELNKRRGLLRAYVFFMKGNKQMATVQLNGIQMNTHYYQKAEKLLQTKIKKRKEYLEKGREAKAFQKKFNRPILLTSNQDLGKLFYEVLGANPVYTAKGGNYRTDKSTLESLNLPFVTKLLEMKKYEKARGTYLGQFAREICNGVMYPFFDLNIPVSYRGACLVGDTPILLANRGWKESGVPIKEVKVGDSVYCFDDNLNPQIKKVVKSWKTGKKEIIRIHYYRKGGKLFLDCTCDHKVRLIDGTYIQAQYLKPGDRVLAGSRKQDNLNFTNHLTNGTGIPEYRLIHEKLISPIKDKNIVHHKDFDHFNHEKQNLQQMTVNEHTRIHSFDTTKGIGSAESRIKNIKSVKEGWKNGKYINAVKKGSEHRDWLGLSYLKCFKILAKAKGKVKIASDNEGIDFSTFKKYLKMHNIDPVLVKLRYDKNGEYISKGRLIELSKLGRAKVKNILGHNHYKLLKLYEFYNIDSKRNWGNQYGKFKPGNHIITKVEWLNKSEDVYDLEIEEYHNFFANEICVHNSSRPNFQNLPKHDQEIMKLIRKGIVPSKNSVLSEIDFSGAEVITSATYHKDKNFINYLIDPHSDMHRDNATDLLLLPPDMLENPDYTLEQKALVKKIRFFAKNNWTFAQFYGDWFGSCAPVFWENVIQAGLKLPNGMTCKEWLENKGIYDLGEMEVNGKPTEGSFLEHCKAVEEKMWNERFPEYSQWKKDIVKFYQDYGYIENHFGFRFVGYMGINQCTNFPIQSASFHLLVYTMIKVQKFIDDNNLKTKIIGQIHDSIISDVPKDEIKFYHTGVNKIVKGLKDRFDWLIIPMEIEAEISELREEGGNFSDMREIDPDNASLDV